MAENMKLIDIHGNKIKTFLHLYIKSMGKVFKVTHICHGDDEANKIMASNSDLAVIAIDHEHVYLAKTHSSICNSDAIKDMKETRT